MRTIFNNKLKFINMYTRTILLIIAIAFTAQSTFAGDFFKNIKIKKIGIHTGGEQDILMGKVMSNNYFNSLANNPNLNEALENRIDANYFKHSGVCENPHIRLSLSLQLPKPNHELQLGLISVTNRLDGLSYHKLQGENLDYAYFNYDLNSNEFAVEANYVYNKEIKIINNIFHLNIYGLGGTNFGYQYANRLVISGTKEIPNRQFGARLQAPAEENINFEYTTNGEDFANTYNASNAINQRAYVGGGIGAIFFNRLELGVKGKFGYGYRYHFSNDFAATNIRSFDLNAKWILK